MTVEAPSRTREANNIVSSVGGATTAAAVPQSPRPPASDFHAHWEIFARFPNFWEGHVLAGLLRSEDVPAQVLSLSPLFDSGFSAVLVPRELVHRARWVLAWPPPSEAELTFLATGELPNQEEGE